MLIIWQELNNPLDHWFKFMKGMVSKFAGAGKQCFPNTFPEAYT
jgi:hypothetical protein